MRLWSLHPKYLDFPKGLGGLWKEAVQASYILMNPTKKMKHYRHPQTFRFKYYQFPVTAISAYMKVVYKEVCTRRTKVGMVPNYNKVLIPNMPEYLVSIPVTDGQVMFEKEHLLQKLRNRDYNRYKVLRDTPLSEIELHPIFYEIVGLVESWEKDETVVAQ